MATKQLQPPWLRWMIDHPTARSLRSSVWGFADQALISAANLIMMVLLARQLGPKSFGVFILVYTTLLFFNSVQSALFTQPHNVLGVARTGIGYAKYTSATFLMQLVYSAIIGSLIAVIAITFIVSGRAVGQILLAIAFAIVTWQIQEFCRRVLYTQGDYGSAFTNDLVTYGGQVLIAAGLWWIGKLTATSAICAIATASLMGGVLGAFRLRASLLIKPSQSNIRNSFRENWLMGRWLLGSNLTYWLSGQLYPVLTAGFVGLGATGGMRASQLLSSPPSVLQQSLATMMPSQSARIYRAHGFSNLIRYSQRYGLPLIAFSSVYGIGLCLFADPIISMLFGDAYIGYTWLVYAFAAFSILGATDMIAFTILKSAEITRPAFIGSATSAVFVLTGGIALVSHFGLAGAITGRALDLIIRNVVLWASVVRVSRQANSNAP